MPSTIYIPVIYLPVGTCYSDPERANHLPQASLSIFLQGPCSRREGIYRWSPGPIPHTVIIGCNNRLLFHCVQMHNHKPIVCRAGVHMPPFACLGTLPCSQEALPDCRTPHVLDNYQILGNKPLKTASPSSAQLTGSLPPHDPPPTTPSFQAC